MPEAAWICEITNNSLVAQLGEKEGVKIMGTICGRLAAMIVRQGNSVFTPVCLVHGEAWMSYRSIYEFRYLAGESPDVKKAIESIVSTIRRKEPA